MKWKCTEQLIASTTKLAALYAKYHCKEFLDARPMAKYKEVCQEDLDSMRSNIDKMNVESVVEELEDYLCFDNKQNTVVFKVWNKKLKKAQCWLYVIGEEKSLAVDFLSFKVRRFDNEPWNPDEYCRYIAAVIKQKLTHLQYRIDSILQEYNVKSAIDGEDVVKENRCKNKSFSSVIQAEDKTAFLQRLHKVIDGKNGKDVAAALYQAKKEGYITRYPTKAEYEAEFTLIGSWQGIWKHLDKGDSNDMLIAGSAVYFK